MDSDNNSFLLSSPLNDQDNNIIPASAEDVPAGINPDGERNDMTDILNQFATKAKLEGSVYRKLLEELKRMSNQIP